MFDRSLESPFYIFGHKILIIAPTEKDDLPMDLSDRVEYGFEIYDNFRSFIRKLIKTKRYGLLV